jgi:hypothetical protein
MQKENSNNNHIGRYLGYAMIVLAVVFVALIVFLVLDYRHIRRTAMVSARESWLMAVVHNHGPLTATGVGYVRPWMTFDYINKLFALPPDYLKARLVISDTRYPQLTISKYASGDHLDLAAFLGKLDDAIRSYVTTASTSTAP